MPGIGEVQEGSEGNGEGIGCQEIEGGGGEVRTDEDEDNDLAAEKEASNMGMVRGSGPSHPPKKVGLAKSRLMGRLTGREAANEE